ncbi:MAG: hypothetical protein KDB03_24670 [Planctomycetales bacterium]|nr:hypothetical protein [Planctomycetales bacterium]
MNWTIDVFGVRHLSPMGAWHLLRFLEEKQPDLILVEGLDDAKDLIPDICRRETRPPIAILAYTSELPVRTIVYPFARYSPEYQAIKWAHEHAVRVEFFDLPSTVFLGLIDREQKQFEAQLANRHCETSENEGKNSELDLVETPVNRTDKPTEPPASPTTQPSKQFFPSHSPEPPPSLYTRIAEQAGERDYETYWERNFEHSVGFGIYRHAALGLGETIRELEAEAPKWRAENLIREAYMRRRIENCIHEGYDPAKIVAVVGAFHASVLSSQYPAMSDEEFQRLPQRDSKLTLMPYSYFKLSSQSGYGAGNHAPAYFELLWDTLAEENQTVDLSRRYMTHVARAMRQSGTHRSTAEVIEAVRLAETLSAFKDGTAPTLSDLRDAAVTLLGHGELVGVRDSLARVEVGTEIGELPKGVSQTSIQGDFDRELHRLKLQKYRKTVEEKIDLDLRENRRVKSREAAFLDLHRSSFFHRLRVLEIPFAKIEISRQENATWAECWRLQWSPESEIALVEAVLLGETVEVATAYKFDTLLSQSGRIQTTAALVADACQCNLLKSMDQARRRLQELAVLSRDFVALAFAVGELSATVRFGDVRQSDTSSLQPLVQELFTQASLNLFSSCTCDDKTVPSMTQAIDCLNRVAFEMPELAEEHLWLLELRKLADADDRNPILSGYACAVLLERGELENEQLSQEVSRRLSPGVAADLGAGWFEGLANRNRYSLLARQSLWEQLAQYVAELDEEQFRRALVFLRRAFGNFSVREKRNIAENLGELWGTNVDATTNLLELPLNETEKSKMAELDEFGFDDL